MTTAWGEGFKNVPLDKPDISVVGPNNVQLVGGKWTGAWKQLTQYYRGEFVEPPVGGVSFCIEEHVSTTTYDATKFARLFDSSVLDGLVLDKITGRQVISGVSGNISLSVNSLPPISSVIYVLSNAASITTMSAGSQDGQLIGITNSSTSSANLTVKDASRFSLAADVVLEPGNGITFIYDEGSDVFRPYSLDKLGGDYQTDIDAINALIAKMLTGSAVSTVTAAAGVITPTKYIHKVEGEGAATDDVTHIATTNVPDGYLLLLTWAGINTITLKHNAGGAGSMTLRGNVDAVLNGDGKFIILIRTGTTFKEIARLGFAADTAPSNPMSEDLNAGGYAIYNNKPAVATIADAAWTVDMANYRGKKVKLTHASACVVTLPNSGVAVDDIIYFEQKTPTLTFTPASGATLTHPLAHNKGLGIGSWIMATVASIGPVVWYLVGMTTKDSTDPLARTAVWNILDTTTLANANAIDWTTGATTGFNVQNGDKWVYFAYANMQASVYVGTNRAKARMLANTTPLMEHVRDRSPGAKTQRLMMWGQSISADAAHTLSAQVKLGATGYSASLAASSVLALKLGSNDRLVQNAAEVTASSGTYVNSINDTFTYTAGDYLVLASFLAGASDTGGTDLGKFALEIDGVTTYDEAAQSVNPGTDMQPVFIMKKVTLSGSKNIKIKVASNDTQTCKIKEATLVVLSLADFKSYLYDEDDGEETNTSGTLQAKASVTGALEAGWYHLVLSSIRLQPPTVSDGYVKSELQINGTTLGGVSGVDSATNDSYATAAYKAPTTAMMRVVEPVTGSDTYRQMWASGTSAQGAKAKLSRLAVLALKPVG